VSGCAPGERTRPHAGGRIVAERQARKAFEREVGIERCNSRSRGACFLPWADAPGLTYSQASTAGACCRYVPARASENFTIRSLPALPVRAIRIALPVLVLVGAVLGARAILDRAPEAERSEPSAGLRTVEATVLSPTRYAVELTSRGTVRPSRRTALAPEVSGTVSALSPRFVAGGAFPAGETLIELDDRDYRIALTRAQANLAQADAALAEQRAQAETARADWRALGRRGEPSALTLREPQTAAARASREAAEAEVQRARLDLARTRITAAYPGRVLSREIDEGQFVARGAPLGIVYATESVEVRLPIGTRQRLHLQLPGDGDVDGAPVRITLGDGIGSHHWDGRLLRVEGVDADTQQLNLIARIEEPFADPANPLRIGRHVEARIDGRTLDSVFVIPRASLRADDEVLLLGDGERLQRRAVTLVWSDDEVAVVSEGLSAGEVLVLTPLGSVADGTPVRAAVDGAMTDAAADTAAQGGVDGATDGGTDGAAAPDEVGGDAPSAGNRS